MTAETDSEFRRRMARFEIAKARRLQKEGRLERAAMALTRAKIWKKSACT